MKDTLLVSIIIPTLNSEGTIGMCLESIKNQSYKNVEVVVVDGFSEDGTREIAEKYGVEVVVAHSNKPESRNIGFRHSKGAYIFHIDSDMILTPIVVEECVSYFKKGYDALIIPEIVVGGTFSKLRSIEKEAYAGDEHIEATRAVKRDVVENLGGFDENIVGPDEYDFHLRAKRGGYKIGRTTAFISVFDSWNPRKKFRHGKYFSLYKQKHKDGIRFQSSPVLRVKLLWEKIPRKYLLFILTLKFIEYILFMLGYFASFSDRKILRLKLEVSSKFDDEAEFYERDMYKNSIGSKYVNQSEMEIIDKIMPYIRDKKILDVGAGNGRWSREFTKYASKVVALDVSKKMCGVLRDEINVKNFEVLNVDIEKVNFDSKFDVVFSFRSFKYAKNYDRVINMIKRALNEKGVFIVEIPNLYNPFYFLLYALAPYLIHIVNSKYIEYFIFVRMFLLSKFKGELEEVGFKVKNIIPLFFFPHFVYSKINSKKRLSIIAKLDKILVKALSFGARSFVIIAEVER